MGCRGRDFVVTWLLTAYIVFVLPYSGWLSVLGVLSSIGRKNFQLFGLVD